MEAGDAISTMTIKANEDHKDAECCQPPIIEQTTLKMETFPS